MVKKGLSYEEKRTRMLDFFYEHQTVFALKELEKQLPKVKGITMQTVKEILQSLVDDFLVDYDKIGAGNFYWALPSKAKLKRLNIEEGLEKQLEESAQKKIRLEEVLSSISDGRTDSEDRRALLDRLYSKREELAKIEGEIEYVKSHGSHKIEALGVKVKTCKDAVNRWTDNIYNVLTFIKKQRPDMQDSQLLEYFGLEKDFDYID